MLSQNFSLAELTRSQTAARHGIDNTPQSPTIIANLTRVCERILEPVRAYYGVPFSPSSGYRCMELNRAIGGSPTSQHMEGEAADFEVPGVSNFDLATWISESLSFDQLILEFYRRGDPDSGWVHCSITGNANRGQILTIGKGYSHFGLRP